MAHGGFAPEISHQTRPSGMPLLPGGRALALERCTAWLPGVLSGRFVGDAQTITFFSIESFFRFFHATPPSPQPPQPVVVGPYMSIFELFYYLIDVLLLDV